LIPIGRGFPDLHQAGGAWSRLVEGALEMATKRRSGRFSLEEDRQLMLMASDGATVEAAAANFRASPETIERKVAKFGIQLKSAAWAERQKAVRAALLAGNAKVASRSKDPWTLEEDSQLRASLAEGQTVRMIVSQSKRTTRAIRRRAEILELSWLKAKAR
jgi:hypothetical protein